MLINLFTVYSYAQFTDSFTDLDFTSNPTWSGDQADFQVTPSGILQLNAPAVSATKYLSTPSSAINNASWEFTSRITVNPSGSNFTEVYLVSNTNDLSAASINGYFVKIGGTSDEVSLYLRSGGTTTEIIDGIDGLVSLNDNNVRVQVTRTATGDWELYTDTTTGFTGYTLEGTITDNTHTQSLFSGVSCTFTSTRADDFLFDDFVVTGTAPIDNTPPSLDTVIVTSSITLDVQFNEPLDLTSAQTASNFTVNNGIGNPTTAVRDASDFSLVHLTFSTPFSNGVFNNLDVTNIQDIALNTLTLQGQQFIYFIPVPAVARDILINELIADPTPTNGLPEEEFIELYNNSSKVFDLAGWSITDGSSTATLGSYILLPDAYVIICSNSVVGDFFLYPNVLGVSSFPSLNNSGENLTLRDDLFQDIDFVSYTSDQYDGTGKEGGGWTLEQVNPNLPCFNKGNWLPSNNANGGTPGTVNSVLDTLPDTIAPSIVSIIALSDSQLLVTFDETIDTAALKLNNTTVSLGRTLVAKNDLPLRFTEVMFDVSPKLDTAIIYTLFIDSLTDCSGNLRDDEHDFVLANIPDSGDLVINEILFDPFTGGFDFVEVYNNSNKFIDIYGWSVSKDPVYEDSILEHRILIPGSFLVLTENASAVKMDYITHDPSAFIQIPDLPSFSNDEGSVYIWYSDTSYSDNFNYKDDMHFPLLRDEDGVSLERLDYDRKTNDAGNWHSAAENIGFATPGLVNSQVNPTVFTGEEIGISPEIFSPDNDGFEDILNITYKLDEAGFVGNLNIYDVNGRKIKTLVDNVLLSTEGVFTWDGTTDGIEKARIGTYIIFFEVFSATGEVKSIKKTCVLAHKF